MASRVELFAVVVAAGTPQSAPITTPTAFDIGEVESVEVLVPPGASGLVGFQFTHSGQSILPREMNKFIIADNEVIRWPLSDMPTGRGWGIRAFNADVFEHTLYIRYLVREVGSLPGVVVPAYDVVQADQPAPVPEDDIGEEVS